jgi:hypothetical protein
MLLALPTALTVVDDGIPVPVTESPTLTAAKPLPVVVSVALPFVVTVFATVKDGGVVEPVLNGMKCEDEYSTVVPIASGVVSAAVVTALVRVPDRETAIVNLFG